MNKMLRRALLGGAAVAMMAAGAQAGELEALKAQLEALQNRVQTLEARGATLPEGASLITFERGSKASADELFDNAALDQAPASRGMTIAITPTADLPAPVASIELGGQIRLVAAWHSLSRNDNRAKLNDFDMTARGQIDLRMTTDTAVGRVIGGIQLRGDMGGGDIWTAAGGSVTSNNNTPALNIRTAWATWQMTDALSLTFGQTGAIAALSNVTYPLVSGPFGFAFIDNTRRAQMRLTYNSGPVNFRFGIEDPSQTWTGTAISNYNVTMPDVAASVGFNAGMFGFRAGGEVAKVRRATINKTGWIANAGINMNLGSMVTMSLGGLYTKGLACDGFTNTGLGCVNGTNLVKAWVMEGNLGFAMTETVSMNLSGSYFDAKNDGTYDKGWAVGGNLVYRPVEALQFGLEGAYRNRKLNAGGKDKDAIVGVASWFFF